MEKELKKIMSQIFNVPIETIVPTSSADTIESWDSLRHLDLISELEYHFDLEFTEKQMIEMTSFENVLKIISK